MRKDSNIKKAFFVVLAVASLGVAMIDTPENTSNAPTRVVVEKKNDNRTTHIRWARDSFRAHIKGMGTVSYSLFGDEAVKDFGNRIRVEGPCTITLINGMKAESRYNVLMKSDGTPLQFMVNGRIV